MKTTFKIILAGAAMTAGLTTLAPLANAQPYGAPMGPHHEMMRNDQLQTRIEHMKLRLLDGWNKHELDRVSYNRLNARLYSIINDKRRDDRSGRGLDPNEAASLNSRLDALSHETFFQKHGFAG